MAARHEPIVDPVVVEELAPLQPEMTSGADVNEFVEIGQLAESLRSAGSSAKKVTVLGTASGDAITLSTLTLAAILRATPASSWSISPHSRRPLPQCPSIRMRPVLPN